MRIFALHPNPQLPKSIDQCVRLTGSPTDPGTIDKIGQAVDTNGGIFAHSAMAQFNPFYDQKNAANVIKANGLPPLTLRKQVASEYAAMADLVEKRVGASDKKAAIIVSNPENGPGLTDNYVREMQRLSKDWTSRRELPTDLAGFGPDAWDQWDKDSWAAAIAWGKRYLKGHDDTWSEIMEPMERFAEVHAINTGGMSGGIPRWLTFDFNGHPNLPRSMHRNQVGLSVCNFCCGGAESRLNTGHDKRWLQFLLQLDAVMAIKDGLPFLWSPWACNQMAFALGVTPKALGRFLAYCEAMGRKVAPWWNPHDPNLDNGADMAEALEHCHNTKIKPEPNPKRINLYSKSVTIGGLTTTEGEWLSFFTGAAA